MVETPRERKQNSPSEAPLRTVMSRLFPAVNEGMRNPWFYFYFSFL
jgi:hypothetical protein